MNGLGIIEILLVEDNPGDVELTERALDTSEIPNHLTVASYGGDALAHLRSLPGNAASRPHLILLDLYLPDMSGFDFLAYLKADPGLRRIPVVVMTASETEADVVRSYDLQASGYVTSQSENHRNQAGDSVRASARQLPGRSDGDGSGW